MIFGARFISASQLASRAVFRVIDFSDTLNTDPMTLDPVLDADTAPHSQVPRRRYQELAKLAYEECSQCSLVAIAHTDSLVGKFVVPK